MSALTAGIDRDVANPTHAHWLHTYPYLIEYNAGSSQQLYLLSPHRHADVTKLLANTWWYLMIVTIFELHTLGGSLLGPKCQNLATSRRCTCAATTMKKSSSLTTKNLERAIERIVK